ncbi:radical SAM superfamily enzyme YgiQ (UPF0313 family) [Anaerobacterium chartisolvens]|uniref:Radical SAM superfamily enzyme YgiQ (UPF0313 family) n=1 Tax=Anaerobacterium chartisolvens TaxID=1297424 RepID=A0A369ASE1_9FIRM|nr:radical SAM protein [Anaerobacterium chartisolvens]RCX11137.1 radical SAM superfamily enzyme YgiQ (UPF0313 family) [Anaerobacterium chartisolvens]
MVKNKIPVYAIHLNCDRPPFGLGLIISYLKQSLAPEEIERLDFSSGYIIDAERLREEIEEKGNGIFLFSTYLWNINSHMAESVLIKNRFEDAMIVFGGPFIPRDEELAKRFIVEHPHIDVMVLGEGEDAVLNVIRSYLSDKKYHDIRDITYIKGSEPVFTGIGCIDDVKKLSSPYLSGEYDSFLSVHKPHMVTLETTRGCPFKCAFCDWGQSTNQKIREFDLERIYNELEWVGKNKIPVIELSDSNLGILKRDIKVAEYICEIKERYGFPKEIAANFAKNSHDNVIEIIKKTKEAGLVSQAILSIQTLHSETLRIIGRKNLNEEHYRKSLELFRGLNLPVTIELMLGLPRSTTQSFMSDLQWACDFNLGVYVHFTILIPNTEISRRDFREKYKIVTAAESNLSDPEYLLEIGLKPINENQVVSLESMSQNEFIKMMKLTALFNTFYGESILKYVMFFLKNEHNILQTQFLYDLQHNDLSEYPQILKLRDRGDPDETTVPFTGHEGVLWDTVYENGWEKFYSEVKQYILANYDIADGEELQTVLDIQQFVMGYYGRTLPATREFKYDFPQYFKDIVGGKKNKGLAEYGKCRIKVTDPLNLCSKSSKPDYYEPHHGHIELASDLNAIRFGFDLNEIKDY